MKSFFFVLAVVAVIAVADQTMADGCINICKHSHITKVPGCDLKAKECKCILDDKNNKISNFEADVPPLGHSKYDVEVTDPVTGKSGSSGHQRSATEAGEIAIVNLFLSDDGCNCHGNSTKIGNGTNACHVDFRLCFFWASVGNLASKLTSARIYAQITSPRKSPSFEATAANMESKTDLEGAGYKLYADMMKFDPTCFKSSNERMNAVKFVNDIARLA